MNRRMLLICVAGCLVSLSWGVSAAEDQGDSGPSTVILKADSVSEGLVRAVDIPEAHSNPDPRIKESLTMNTEALHGFKKKSLEVAVAERIAMLPGASDPGKSVAVAGYGDYRIDAGDIVEFMSFDDDTLNREMTVRYDGQVSLPLIQDVEVGGLTRGEAEEAIRKAYTQVFREPEISFSVISTESKTYTVMGDVSLPGLYPYTRATTLSQALSQAGGLRQRGGSDGSGFIGLAGQITKALVIRYDEGERAVYPFDLRGLGKPGAYEGDTPIYYGDLIYVPEGVNLVYLLGESLAPVIVELTERMTLLQMLSLSGGFNASTARLKEVVLLREVDENNTEIHLVNIRKVLKNEEQDIRLVPGDVVYIPQKRLVRISEFVTRFTGSISPLFNMYTDAVDAWFAWDLSDARLDALEDSLNINVGTRGRR